MKAKFEHYKSPINSHENSSILFELGYNIRTLKHIRYQYQIK